MNKLVAVILAGASFASVPAYASDAPVFSGARVGVDAGWGRLGGGGRTASDGFTYGANLGYDFAVDSVRIGPDLEISDSTQKNCVSDPTAGVGAKRCQRSDRDLYAGVRIGYVASPNLMLYAKGGYTNGRFSEKVEDAGVRTSDYVGRDRDGYRLGAGAEYAVTPHFYLTGEYRYSHWDDHIHQNQLLGGVGYRF